VLYAHFGDGASEYLTRRFGPSFSISPNRLTHLLMVVGTCENLIATIVAYNTIQQL
jgi:hypothetical protein